jgi:Tfp pilus assembly protein PilN
VIRINFLPEQKQPAARAKTSPMRVAMGAVVLAGVGAASFYGYQVANLNALEKELEQTRQQVTEVQALVQQAQALRAEEEALVARMAVVEGLRGRIWSAVLLGFADLTPKGLSWQTVVADDQRIHLTGHARTLTDIAQFMTGLVNDPHVQQTALSTAVDAGGRYAFDLTVELAPRLTQPEGGTAHGAK